MPACKECKVSEDNTFLSKCPICHEMVCEEHKYTRCGRAFCSVHCADSFFHYEDEDMDEE